MKQQNLNEITNRNLKDLIIKNVLGVIFALSSAILSFQVIVKDYTYLTMSVTIIVSFLCALYFWEKTLNENIENLKNNKVFSIVCAILASFVIFKLYQTKGMQNKEIFNKYLFNPFRLRGFIISLLSILYIGVFLGNKIEKWILNIYKKLDSWDKKAYLILSFVFLGIIIFAYSLNSNWYLTYDKIYSLDSGWCFKNILPESSYYDIRHPVLSIFTFPIYAIVSTIVKFVISGNLSDTVIAIIIQFLNIQILILTGFLLKLLTKKKSVFLIYMLSFPTLLFSLFLEKYALCVFFIVLYIYSLCNENKNESITGLISATICMPTSCFIGILEFFTSDKVKEKILRILKIIFITLLILICFGRSWVLFNGPTEAFSTQKDFSNKSLNIQERTIATLKMIQGCIFALPSIATGDIYFWDGTLTSNISILSLVIFAIMIIGIIKNRKSFFVKSCTVWTIFSFVLFVILKWSAHTTPLFSLYFSWAIIPLFVMGLDYLFEKLKINKKAGYVILMFLMLVINITTILDISKLLAIFK